MVLFGEYHQRLDARRRVMVPEGLRAAIGAGELARGLVLTRGLDRCIFAFPASVWEGVASGFSSTLFAGLEARMFERLLLGSAVEVGVDKGGRMPLPDALAAWAGLEEEAVVLGASARIEVWSPARWRALRDSVEGQYEELAERFFRQCCGRSAG